MRHELWSDSSFFPRCNRQARAVVEAGAELVWTVDAADWDTAMRECYEYKGWEPYKPMDGDPVTYTAEQEAEAERLV